MIEIQMSRDIREFSPKLIGPFTSRQVICILIALSYGIPLLFMLPFQFYVRMFIVLALAAIPIACGWIAPFGVPLEKFVFIAGKILFSSTLKRKYVSKNEFVEEYKKLDKETTKPLKKTKQSKTIKGYS